MFSKIRNGYKIMVLKRGAFLFFILLSLFLLSACHEKPKNNPYPRRDADKNIFYADFDEQPKTLDPARSYSEDEAVFVAQIYEPPLQYHYLKRPVVLTELTATKIPTPVYVDKAGNVLPENADPEKIAYTYYDVTIKPGIFYAPHPAFAKDKKGNYYYHHLTSKDLRGINTLNDFKKTGTRELTAEDYVYEVKRLASPKVPSPIYGFMNRYILGLSQYHENLTKELKTQKKNSFLDLRNYPLEGAKVLDPYTYRITLQGKYPQFRYWLAMNFFAPIPWEADKFYSQPGMKEKNISFDWYPVGTGPYVLTENNPNREMVLEKNPRFHGELYPTTGEASDAKNGFLVNAGQPLPFVDKFVFTLEKESIPRWNKFLQGYYDQSGIGSDNFDEAIKMGDEGSPELTKEMKEKNIQLRTTINPSLFYLGFNWKDSKVGGDSESAVKLRQALAIAVNYEEYISIFMNGRGVPAQGPIPPGIFGYTPGKDGLNTYVYDWQNNQAQRKSIDEAKKLLSEAGYPGGYNAKTGEPLVLNLDITEGGGSDQRAQFDWFRQQFQQLNIQLNIRSTDYNRFQDKLASGNVQLFFMGWNADYPDPENFLFLFYGPNGKVLYGGENVTNYSNPDYDALFIKMKNMNDGPERQDIINQMQNILRHDTPWLWGFHPKSYILSQQWVSPRKPHPMANNSLKYVKIFPKEREILRERWNKDNPWPLVFLAALIGLFLIPVIIRYWQKEHKPPLVKKRNKPL